MEDKRWSRQRCVRGQREEVQCRPSPAGLLKVRSGEVIIPLIY